jgi:hypothetical protein
MSKVTLTRGALWMAMGLTLCFGLGGSCKSDTPSNDTLDADTVGDPPDADVVAAGPDAGPPDASGPPPCSNDDECKPEERCDNLKGYCIAAVKCKNANETVSEDDQLARCNPSSEDDEKRAYCDKVVGLGCRCFNAPDGNGYCKRRLPPCTACTTDEQCGDSDWFKTSLHEPAKCVTSGDGKYCLEKYTNLKCTCGKASTIDGAAYCVPQDGSTCADGTFLCCNEDPECPPEHPLCDTITGRCIDLCTFDFDKKESVGCRADRSCHVDPQYLDPADKNYGAGRCGKPCATNSECKYLRDDFVCKNDSKGLGRCRPAGCLNDLECPVNLVDDPEAALYPYIAYCDRYQGICTCSESLPCNCRTTNDPVTGTPYKDCKGGFKCEQTSQDPGQCIKKNCVEEGGAELMCGWGEFCCGQDRNNSGDWHDDSCKNEVGIDLAKYGDCFAAPNPPWCLACEGKTWDECDHPLAPKSTKDPNMCLGGVCVFACELLTQCPVGFNCTVQPVTCTDNPTTCGDSSRCYDSLKKDQNGNAIMYCRCTTGGQKGGECPAMDAADPLAPVARCTDTASPSSPGYCIWTQACMPGPNVCQ